MRGAFAPRFAIEAGFLILLGVGAGYADLRPRVIVGLVAGGWVLVALIELAIWRSQARPMPTFAVAASAPEEVEDGPGPEPESKAVVEETAGPARADDVYPLRSDAGDAPSEEVEAYTRVLSGTSEHRSPAQQGD
jgi:hypothetical protein